MKKGKYIVFEGGEGCGKSTQSKLLYENLISKGYDCIHIREPGSTKEAQKLRCRLLNSKRELSVNGERILFARARHSLFEQVIIPALNEDKIVLSDRSFYSTLAYQGYGSEYPIKSMENLIDVATFGIKPDLAIMIDIDPKIGLKKEINPDRFAQKLFEYHQRVNQGFLQLARDNKECILIPYVEGKVELMQESIQYYLKQRLNL
ncbi:MAG TPA: dTMP kinase [Nanoarchaeota archaeon]|nr:dTMP kinase [Nanoarchaeota archaeon]HIH63848.1 dTMP kinase [Nanoarchaeota archaeon]HIJ10383.1 dTMP kinase [Nanoarchaeota archaeon]